MTIGPSYKTGFAAPRRGLMRYPHLWRGILAAWAPNLGQSGSVLRDWSSYGNHGTLTNMDAASDWVVSGGKLALDFDGSNDSVDIAKSIVPTGSSAKTASLWFRSTTTISTRQWMLYAGTEANYSRFCLEIESSKLTFNYFIQAAPHSTTLVANRWYHAAVVYEAGATSVRVFLDGVGESSTLLSSTALNTGTTSNTRIGIFTSGALPFTGQLDDVNIWNRALSDAEIRLLASRRGVMYEMLPQSVTKATAVAGGFNAGFAAGSNILIGV